MSGHKCTNYLGKVNIRGNVWTFVGFYGEVRHLVEVHIVMI